MKYVTLNLLGEDSIILFPKAIAHKEIVEAVRFMKVENGRGQWSRAYVDLDIVSAGFVDYAGNCHGESISLDVQSRPVEDTELLRSQYD